jgi:hypothetical protein
MSSDSSSTCQGDELFVVLQGVLQRIERSWSCIDQLMSLPVNKDGESQAASAQQHHRYHACTAPLPTSEHLRQALAWC